ncbi:rab-GTPase-TBC domain-containing protein [Umbelopsis sp. AD052]|nr:rab-GTPase-TBC domain-containing protein [Umbelopsis sp. AD052]
MSKKYSHIPSFNNNNSRDNILLEVKKPTLSNLVHASHNTEAEIKKTLRELRFFIFKNSILGSSQKYRQKVWKLLLEVYYVSANCYKDLLENGVSEYHKDIVHDSTITLFDDGKDSYKATLKQMQRVLNSFVWLHAAHWKFTYVTTMSFLAVPFITILPELDAFFTFTTFIRHCCPLYAQPNLLGAHCGVKLLDVCLKIVDPELSGYLRGKGLTADIFAFKEISTLSALVQPLSEALHLWDVMIAFGVHLNILFNLAQLVKRRTKILSSTSPIHLIRSPPPLDALSTINLAFQLIDILPSKTYLQLVRHPYDETIAHELGVDVPESEQDEFIGDDTESDG